MDAPKQTRAGKKAKSRLHSYCADTLYLLLGAIFVPIYGLFDLLPPNSFRDGTYPDAPIQWQQFLCFSYATLTSSGYGDILPISWWARSFANIEMITGVLFITIVMSRLVSFIIPIIFVHLQTLKV